jgi:Na+-transporting NADH:ubiquinone oxidoreductase subunit C
MKDFSNRYIFIFAMVMVAIVAIVLSLTATLLKPAQDRNYEVEKKKSMLESIGVFAEREEVAAMYDRYIKESFVVDPAGNIIAGTDAFGIDLDVELKKSGNDIHLPVFKAVTADNEDVIIVPVSGTGLWGPIWGYIALKSDMNTIFGVTYDHQEETPGLGAEINTTHFESQFPGKKLFEGDSFVSISLIKTGADPSDQHAVDAISGGTITSRGLEAMLKDCLALYEPFLKSNMNR